MGQRIGRYLRPGRCDGTPSHDQPQSQEPSSENDAHIDEIESSSAVQHSFQTMPGTPSPASVDDVSEPNNTVNDESVRDEHEDATLVNTDAQEFDVDSFYSVSVTNSEDILLNNAPEFDVDSLQYCGLKNNKETQTCPVHISNANEGDAIPNDFNTLASNTGMCKTGQLINEANVQIHAVHPSNNVVSSENNADTSDRHGAVFLGPIFKNNRPKLSFRCQDYSGPINNGRELIGVTGSSRSRSATSNRFTADQLTRTYKPLSELSDHHEQARIGRELAGQTAGNTQPVEVAMNKAQRMRAKSVEMKMKLKPNECKTEESATKTGLSDSMTDETEIINVKTTLPSPNCEVKLNRAHLARVEAVKKNVEAMKERDRRRNKKTSSITQIVSRPPPVKVSDVKTTSESMTQQPPLLIRNYIKTTSESITRLPPLVIRSNRKTSSESNRKTSSESIPFHKPTSVKSDAIKSFPNRIVMKLPCVKMKDAAKPVKKNAVKTGRQVRFADDHPESRSPVNDERSKRIVFTTISTACSFQEKEVAKCKPSTLRSKSIQPSTQENTNLRGRTSNSTQPLGNIKTKTKSAKPKNSALTPVQIPSHMKQNHSSNEVTGAQPKTKSIKHKSKHPAPKSDQNEQRTAKKTSVYKLNYSHRTVKPAESSSDQNSIQTNTMEKVSEHVRPIVYKSTSGSDTDLLSEKANLEVDGPRLEDNETLNYKQPEIILIPRPKYESQSPISYIEFAKELEDMPPYQGPAKEPEAGCSTGMRQQNVPANDSETNEHDPTLYTWEDEAVLRRYRELNSETHFRSPRNTVQEAPVNRPRYHTHDDYINLTKLHDEGPAYAFTSRRHTKKLLQFDTAPAFGHSSRNEPSCSSWEHETAQQQYYRIDTSHAKPVPSSTQAPITPESVVVDNIPPTRRMPAASATHKYVANSMTTLPEECGYYPGIAAAVKREEEFGYVPRRPSKNLKTNGSSFKYTNT